MDIHHLHLDLREGRLGTKMGGALVLSFFSSENIFFYPCSQRTGGFFLWLSIICTLISVMVISPDDHHKGGSVGTMRD